MVSYQNQPRSLKLGNLERGGGLALDPVVWLTCVSLQKPSFKWMSPWNGCLSNQSLGQVLAQQENKVKTATATTTVSTYAWIFRVWCMDLYFALSATNVRVVLSSRGKHKIVHRQISAIGQRCAQEASILGDTDVPEHLPNLGGGGNVLGLGQNFHRYHFFVRLICPPKLFCCPLSSFNGIFT